MNDIVNQWTRTFLLFQLNKILKTWKIYMIWFFSRKVKLDNELGQKLWLVPWSEVQMSKNDKRQGSLISMSRMSLAIAGVDESSQVSTICSCMQIMWPSLSKGSWTYICIRNQCLSPSKLITLIHVRSDVYWVHHFRDFKDDKLLVVDLW